LAEGITPSQTVGPFFHDALLAGDQTRLVNESDPQAIRLGGTVYDGAGEPVPDAMIELWRPTPKAATLIARAPVAATLPASGAPARTPRAASSS
jgi:protocatechuate 3,4-dioxygenase alpha subunit